MYPAGRNKGKRITIPEIDVVRIPQIGIPNHDWKKYTVLNVDLHGRPSRVLKKFIDIGFERHWFKANVFEDLIVFGWDRGYLKTDAGILSLPFRYFLKDMNWTKKRRLKEVDENANAL